MDTAKKRGGLGFASWILAVVAWALMFLLPVIGVAALIYLTQTRKNHR